MKVNYDAATDTLTVVLRDASTRVEDPRSITLAARVIGSTDCPS